MKEVLKISEIVETHCGDRCKYCRKSETEIEEYPCNECKVGSGTTDINHFDLRYYEIKDSKIIFK